MSKLVPGTLPAAYKMLPGSQPATSDVDTGGYDVLIGGYGFRLATDQQFPYMRSSEPTTVHRFDNSAEVGEQTLSPLPWLKSQSSFHAGAGQLNLEAPFTAFQYQQEQIAHLRFDTSLGVDPWTPGKVSRLPDTTFSNFGFDVKCIVTSAVNGVDVAVVGGVHSLYQITWAAGPDAAPTITAMDLTSATYGGINNITITSLTTDGLNYYGLLQLGTAGSTAGILTYVISGSMSSAAQPTALYEVPNYKQATPRTNLCTNPSFETGTTSWASNGTNPPALATNTVPAPPAGGRTNILQLTLATGTSGGFNGIKYTLATTVGQVYTVSAKVYVPTGVVCPIWLVGSGFGSSSAVNNAWTTVSYTFTATAASTVLTLWFAGSTTAGQLCYVDEVLMEQAGAVGAYFDGSTTADANYTYGWNGATDASSSSASPIVSASNAYGCVGWSKERLIGAFSNSVYELATANVSAHSALGSAKYTHPVTGFMYSAISESPGSIMIAGSTGNQSSILKFQLDTTGSTPTLGGGATVAVMPTGELIQCMTAYLGSFIALGTNKGLRVGTFDTYTGNLTYGPLTLVTTSPVYAITGRDRFIFAGYSNQQADGTTGLARVDLSQPTDASGRLAWCPDLRPPTSATSQTGIVYGVAVLPNSGRLMFATSAGFHVEGNGPGSNGTAWIRTSRIRYDTDELKLFKAGRIHGSLDTATIGITGITQFGISFNLGTFGFLSGATDPGEFGLPTGLNPWIQLQLQLNGSTAVLNSYVVKALPAPTRQRIITMTVNCFRQETDRYGLDVTDPLLPRDRYQALKALEGKGDEIRLVEFTNTGPVATLVVIDKLDFHSFSRPNIDDDFGGYITVNLRETVGS